MKNDLDKERRAVEDVKPYAASGSKSKQVETMFDSIAPAYDLMNACMSLGMHNIWRDMAPPGREACRPA